MLRTILAVFLLTILPLAVAADQPAPPTVSAPLARAVSVVDGDTIKCHVFFPWGAALANQNVRAIGYDAPEISKRRQATPPVTDAEVARGKQAKEAAKSLFAKSSAVYLVPDPGEPERDTYGRILARVFVATETGVVDLASYMTERGFGERSPAPTEPDPPPTTPPAPSADPLVIRGGETLLLDGDRSFLGDAVYLAGPGATLDLGGHTIRYGIGGGDDRHGVHLYLDWADGDRPAIPGAGESANCVIRNGSIVLAGTGARCHAVYGYRGNNVALQNVRMVVSGKDASAAFIRWGSGKLTNCAAVSTVNATDDRHVVPGVFQLGGGSQVSGCVVIGGNSSINVAEDSSVSGCFLSPSSFCTNGYGVGTYKVNNVRISGNLIAPENGRGIILQYGEKCQATDNVILAWERPNSEFGSELNACGVRCRYDAKGHTVARNMILAVGGGERCSASGLYLTDYANQNFFTDNILMAIIAGDYKSRRLYAKTISLEGQGGPNGEYPATDSIRDNTVLGNHYLISFSGYDGGTVQTTPIERPKFGWTTPAIAAQRWIEAARNKLSSIGMTGHPDAIARWQQIEGLLKSLPAESPAEADRSTYFPAGKPPAVPVLDPTKEPGSEGPLTW